MNLNIYEIRINDDFIENQYYIDNFLFDCQCALFLVDITNPESFELIQKLAQNIQIEKFPYLKIILVLNKLDLKNNRKISDNELKEFLVNNKSLDNIEISIKEGNNIFKLIKKLNALINESIYELPINIVLEANKKIMGSLEKWGALSIVLLGDIYARKEYFFHAYFKNKFNSSFPNISIDKDVKFIKIGNDVYKITLWDTIGSEKFRTLNRKCYQNADGILLLFNITNEETFNKLIQWIGDIKEYNLKKENEAIIYLIGSQIDLENEREVSREKAEEYAKSFGVKYFEINYKINLNIQEVMARMIMECHMKINNIQDIKDCFKLKPIKKKERFSKNNGCH